MKLVRRFAAVSVLSLLVAFPLTAYLCDTERWDVKVCTDPNVKVLFQNNSVTSHQLKPFVPTTINHLIGFSAPQLALHTPRLVDTEPETTIYRLVATLIEYKWENDPQTGVSDYHLVIRDSQRHSMVAEIPNPNCLAQTPQPLRNMITQARHDFDAKFSGSAHATGSFQPTNMKVRITGQGFFDRPHASASAANGIEIHPVLKIEFLSN
jgi:hypothetical protein